MRCLVSGVGEGKVRRGIVIITETDRDPMTGRNTPCWRVSTRRPPIVSETFPKENCTPELAASMFVQNVFRLCPILGAGLIGE